MALTNKTQVQSQNIKKCPKNLIPDLLNMRMLSHSLNFFVYSQIGGKVNMSKILNLKELPS